MWQQHAKHPSCNLLVAFVASVDSRIGLPHTFLTHDNTQKKIYLGGMGWEGGTTRLRKLLWTGLQARRPLCSTVFKRCLQRVMMRCLPGHVQCREAVLRNRTHAQHRTCGGVLFFVRIRVQLLTAAKGTAQYIPDMVELQTTRWAQGCYRVLHET